MILCSKRTGVREIRTQTIASGTAAATALTAPRRETGALMINVSYRRAM
jgi:hypothetical protein